MKKASKVKEPGHVGSLSEVLNNYETAGRQGSPDRNIASNPLRVKPGQVSERARDEELILDIHTQQEAYYTEVFSWGSDSRGQLGLGLPSDGDPEQEQNYPVPRFCSYNITIREISCGRKHAGFITQNNYLYTMGSNNHGQLGIGEPLKFKNSPILVEKLPPNRHLTHISCGGNQTFVVLNDEGAVYSWGEGKDGALGIGKVQDQFEPGKVLLQHNTKITNCAAGPRHTVFLDVTGRIFVSGANSHGQLGLNTVITEVEQIELAPRQIPDFSDCAQSVACGDKHTIVLSLSGLVYACGDNSTGQLGDGSRESTNRLKLIDEISHIPMKTIQAGSFSASISEEGQSLFLWGTGSFGEFLTPHRVKKIRGETVGVSIGSGFGVAISMQGFLYSWGDNSNGELGAGDYLTRSTPQLMSQLDTKRVTQICCGETFAIALGQTIRQSTETPGKVGAGLKSAISDEDLHRQGMSGGKNTNSGSRLRYGSRPSVDKKSTSATKLRKSKSSGASSRRMQALSKERVQGNRHLGGCCNHFDSNSAERRTSPKTKSSHKRQRSPGQNGQKYERDMRNVQEEKQQYQRHIEDKFSQMLAEEKAGLEHEFANRRVILEKTMALELEEKMKDQQHLLKMDFADQSRVADTRAYEHEMQREQNIQTRLDEERRNNEVESAQREQALEQRMQARINQQNERFAGEEDVRRRQTEEQIRGGMREEQRRMEEVSRRMEIEHQEKVRAMEAQMRERVQEIERRQAAELRDNVKIAEDAKRGRMQSEDRGFADQERMRGLELELTDVRHKLADMTKQRDDLWHTKTDLEQRVRDYDRLRLADDENKMLRDQRREDEFAKGSLSDNVKELERQNLSLRDQVMENDRMIQNFSDEISKMGMQIDQQMREQEASQRENSRLLTEIDELRMRDAKHAQLRVSMEEETQRRVNADAEADRLRVHCEQLTSQLTQEQEHMRRALDEMRMQNDDNMKTINQRNAECAQLNRDLLETRHRLGEREQELEELRAAMDQVEARNRALSDKINEIIYNKASHYKDKTLQVLQARENLTDPMTVGRRERAVEFGIPSASNLRLQQSLAEEKLTTSKAINNIQRMIRQTSPLGGPAPPSENRMIGEPTNFAVMQNLERLEEVALTADKGYRSHYPGPPPEYVPRQKSDSPLRQSRSRSPARDVPPRYEQQRDSLSPMRRSDTYSNHRNIEPLIHTSPGHRAQFEQHVDRATEVLRRSGPPIGAAITEDAVMGSAAATVMTSTMIKQSLAELRGKLDRMRRDKDAVNVGISSYESKQYH